jgi:hypothetical protein
MTMTTTTTKTKTTTCSPEEHAELVQAVPALRRCVWCRSYLCSACHRAISKRAKARWTLTGRITCLACEHNGREAHARVYPECPWEFHDLGDHGGHYATQGGLRRLISEGVPS